MRLRVLIIALVTTGCVSVPNHPRFSLIDVDRPFGQPWSLTIDEKVQYLEEEDPAECAEFFEGLDGHERQKQIDYCLQEVRFKSSANLPVPLENGFLEMVYTPSGAIIGRSHIFAFFSSLIQLSEEEDQQRANVVTYEMAQWTAALESRYGPAISYGSIMFGGFRKTDSSKAPCAVWYVEPVAMLLCRSRLITPDASQSSLTFVRVDRVDQGEMLVDEIVNN